MDIREYIQSGVIESYVLGLANEAEVAEVEQLSNEYAEVKRAILDFEILTETQADKNAIQPPAHIKADLEKILRSEFVFVKEPPKKIPAADRIVPVRQISSWRYLAAASVILLIISTALNFYFYSGYRKSNNKYQALLQERNTLQTNNAAYKTSLQLMEDPHMVNIKMTGVPGKEQNIATIYWDPGTKEVYLYPNKMDKIPPGKQFQLWAIVDGKPVDAGMIGNCEGLCKMKVIDHAEAFAVTLEKEGGSTSPTISAMYVSGKV